MRGMGGGGTYVARAADVSFARQKGIMSAVFQLRLARAASSIWQPEGQVAMLQNTYARRVGGEAGKQK
jgi:hypothetical protein